MLDWRLNRLRRASEGPTGSDGFQDGGPGPDRDLAADSAQVLNELTLDVSCANEIDLPTIQKRICPQEGVTGGIKLHLTPPEIRSCEDIVGEL